MAQLPDYISASGLDRFLFCPLAYKNQYITKIWKFDWNEYTAFWKALHFALETNYKQKMSTKEDLSVKEMLSVFWLSLKREVEAVGMQMTDALWNMQMQWEEIIVKYMKEIAPNIQPAAVEMEFEIDLKSIGRKILGYIDLVTEDDIIIDHKTAWSTTRQKRTNCYVDRLLQLTMYSLVFRKLYNRIEKVNRIDVLKRLKSSVGIQSIMSTRTDKDILELVNLLWMVKAVIESDKWYPNLNRCHECDFKNICPKK